MTPRSTNKFMFFLILYQLAASFVVLFAYILTEELFGTSISFHTLQISYQVIAFVIPFFVYIAAKDYKIRDVLNLKPISIKNVIIIILMMIFVQPFMMLVSYISSIPFPNNIATTMEILADGSFLLLLLTIAVTPSICEEIIFRGVILTGYKKVKLQTAALMNGFLFAMMHLDPQQFLYTFALGSLFYVLVHYTSSIFAPVLAHFVINGSQATLLYISMLGAPTDEPLPDLAVSMYTTEDPIMVIISILVVCVVALPFLVASILYFIKYNKAQNNLMKASNQDQDDLEIIDSETDLPYNPDESVKQPIKQPAKQKILDIYIILTFVVYVINSTINILFADML